MVKFSRQSKYNQYLFRLSPAYIFKINVSSGILLGIMKMESDLQCILSDLRCITSKIWSA